MLESLFFSSLLATLFFLIALESVAAKIGLTDQPCHRKQHKNPTPLCGGLAIYLAILLTLLFHGFQYPNQTAYLAASALLVVVGLVDDFRGLSIKVRIVAQLFAGLIMTEVADIKIMSLGDLLFNGNLELGRLATPFTLFAIVGGVNAFNMVDGIDGLAGALSLVSMTTLALVAWYAQDMLLFNFCNIIIAAIIAFLSFNLRIFGFPSASVFLGDTGSTLLGFTVCWSAISASQCEHPLVAPTTVLWIMAIPLFDSVCSMLRRLSRGKLPFVPDREHLHHIMSISGYSVNQVVVRQASYGLIMAIIGIGANLLLNIPEGISLFCFLVLFACHYWGISYAWNILKIARYLKTRPKIAGDVACRRKAESWDTARALIDTEQRISIKRRTLNERRFIPTAKQLDKFCRREEKMNDHDYKNKLKNKLELLWLNIYIKLPEGVKKSV
jgi:UDP-GlcNAc:undecaprenyl-phosphate/decaprenyl-phosphate GlcNAc-1-phosphate transferase